MCRTPREAGCVMRWTALPRYGKKTRTGLFFVPSRRRCFPRSYGFPAGNVPVSDNIPAGFAVTFLAHFFACPDLFCYLCAAKPGQLPPMRSDASVTAPAVARLRGRRSCRGDVELFYIRVELFYIFLYIFDWVFGRYFAVNKCFKGLPAILAQGLNPVLLPPMILVLYEI